MRNRHLYPEDWFSRIRPEALRAANYRCRTCGAQNHKKGYYSPSGGFIQCDQHMIDWAARQGIKIVAIHLQVAHLDQNPGNNDPKNLGVFCPKHHLEYDHAYRGSFPTPPGKKR